MEPRVCSLRPLLDNMSAVSRVALLILCRTHVPAARRLLLAIQISFAPYPILPFVKVDRRVCKQRMLLESLFAVPRQVSSILVQVEHRSLVQLEGTSFAMLHPPRVPLVQLVCKHSINREHLFAALHRPWPLHVQVVHQQ